MVDKRRIRSSRRLRRILRNVLRDVVNGRQVTKGDRSSVSKIYNYYMEDAS